MILLPLSSHSKCFLLALLVVSGLVFNTAAAERQDKYVNWTTLNLNPSQSQEINRIESQWKDTASEVIPQIKQDKAELMQLLNSPDSNQQRIMELQNRINTNKMRLQNAAMQSYLRKKEQLNSEQKSQLQQMMRPGLK